MRGGGVIPPEELRDKILNVCHEGHLASLKLKVELKMCTGGQAWILQSKGNAKKPC